MGKGQGDIWDKMFSEPVQIQDVTDQYFDADGYWIGKGDPPEGFQRRPGGGQAAPKPPPPEEALARWEATDDPGLASHLPVSLGAEIARGLARGEDRAGLFRAAREKLARGDYPGDDVDADLTLPPDLGGEIDHTELPETTERDGSTVGLFALQHLEKWEKKALKRVKDGRLGPVPFESDAIPVEAQRYITRGLPHCGTEGEVRVLFSEARHAYLFSPTTATSRRRYGTRWQERRAEMEDAL